MSTKSVFGIAAILLILLVASKSIYIVSEWERAVLLRFGEQIETDIGAGMHVKVPFMDKVKKFDVRVLTLDSPTRRYLTVDKKPLEVDSYAAWRIADVGRFYRATSGDEARAIALLSARIDNGLRDQFGQRTQHEVISGERDSLMQELTERLDKSTLSKLDKQLLNIRVKANKLPVYMKSSVIKLKKAKHAKEAQEPRTRNNELAESIRATADRQKSVKVAEVFPE